MKLYYPSIDTAWITQEFGVNKESYPGFAGHMGVDLGAPLGSKLFAVADGVVVSAKTDKRGYGIHAIIDHPALNLFTVTGHMLEMYVNRGQRVQGGQVIGTMGGYPGDDVPDGYSTGTHTHFEVRPKGEPRNNGYGGAVKPFVALREHLPAPVAIGVVKSLRGMNVRAEPSAGSTRIGAIRGKEDFDVAEIKKVGNDVWLRRRALRPEWVASLYRGYELVDYHKVDPPSEPEPREQSPDIKSELLSLLDEQEKITEQLRALSRRL